MREIKFRAWHKTANKMFSAEEMGKDQLTIMTNGKGFINVHGGSTKLSQFYTDMIPMQYTGLKDKNGVEIYEGDIIDITERNDDYQETAQVLWNDEEALWSYLRYGDDNEEGQLTAVFDKNTEVIENIYENKNLLITPQK